MKRFPKFPIKPTRPMNTSIDKAIVINLVDVEYIHLFNHGYTMAEIVKTIIDRREW